MVVMVHGSGESQLPSRYTDGGGAETCGRVGTTGLGCYEDWGHALLCGHVGCVWIAWHGGIQIQKYFGAHGGVGGGGGGVAAVPQPPALSNIGDAGGGPEMLSPSSPHLTTRAPT